MKRGCLSAVLFAFGFTLQARPVAPLQPGFEPNRGQTDPRVKFLAHGKGVGLFLTRSEVVWSLTRRGSKASEGVSAALRMKLVDANPAVEIEGRDPLPGRSNYIHGSDPRQWRIDVPRYAKVQYRRIYPGVDLIFYRSERQLEYDFVVAPGADPRTICLAFAGAGRISIDADGTLVLRTAAGEVRKQMPRVFQQANGVRKALAGRYVLAGKDRVRFEVDGYDQSLPLVIDPVVTYSTYLGGSGLDVGQGMAHDSAGNLYVTGYTASTDFPTTSGAVQTANHGGQDTFVVKLNRKTGLIYSTYIGGSGIDEGKSIAVDAGGNAYITGLTSSTDFPTTTGAFQTSGGGACGGNPCVHAFITKLNAIGTGLVYSTYLGSTPGSGNDLAVSLAIDAAGNAYVTGSTNSASFPTTSGAYRTAFGGGVGCGGPCDDAFVSKLNPAGTALVYSTYVGGSNEDFGTGIAIDAAGNAYITGGTSSSDFPVTAGVFQGALKAGTCASGPCSDAFVTKLNPAGTSVIYSTFLGGSGADNGQRVALDASGNAYIVGTTGSTDFPTTAGAFQTAYGGGSSDVFVTAINAAGTALVASTYLGGSGADFGNSIKIGKAGKILVVADTASPNFPAQTAAPARAMHVAARPAAYFGTQGRLGHFNDPLLADWFEDMEGDADSSDGDVDEEDDGEDCETGGSGAGPDGGNSDVEVACVEETPLDTQFAASLTISDPIAVASGELFDLESGFALGGPLPLGFRWFYSTGLSASGFSGALGTNRMHNFEAKLTVTGSSATVTLSNGKTVRFALSGATWTLQTPEPFGYQFANSASGYQMLEPTTRRIYTFSSSGALLRIEDRNGNALAVTQGPNGPTDVADGLGRSLHFTYAQGKLTAVSDQASRSISFAYTGNDLTSFTDASGAITTYSYTAAGSQKSLLAGKKRPAGNTPYTQAYNSQGQVTSQTDSLGNTATLVYDNTRGITTTTDPLGNKEVDTNQSFTATTQHADAAGHTITFAYDQDYHRTSATDRLGNVTTVTYHAASGYPASVTDALGNTTSYVYTAQTQGPFTFYYLTKFSFPDGTSVGFSYDKSGNLLSKTDQAGKTSSFTYDARGQVLTSTNPLGGVTTVVYNSDETVASIGGPMGGVTSYSYDSNKRIAQLTFADGTFRKYAYDALDRPITFTDERGKVTSLAYDANGNLTSFTDPLHKTSSSTYDANDLLHSLTDPLGQTTQCEYDALGSLITVTDAAGE